MIDFTSFWSTFGSDATMTCAVPSALGVHRPKSSIASLTLRCPSLGHIVRQREVGDDLLFGDVDDQPRPMIDLRAVRAHDIRDRKLDQRVDRNVDGEAQIDAELGEIHAGLEHARERQLRQRDSSDSVAPGMNAPGDRTPYWGWRAAGERLDADKLLLPQVDLRLIPELDPFFAERFVEADAGRHRRADGRA